MENISCMRFKYLCEFLTGIEETYTDKNDKSFRISRSARNKLSTLRLCKIDSAKTVRATYDPSSNAVDLTVSGYVYDSVLEDMKEIFDTVDLLNIYATVDSQIHIDLNNQYIASFASMVRQPDRSRITFCSHHRQGISLSAD